jgi:RimJ/RimL family protein N-acetyltransferase
MSAGPLYDGNLFSGPRVRLTALRPEDVPAVQRWYEDSAFSRQFEGGAAFPRPASGVREFISEGDKSNTTYRFGIRLHHTDDLIGLIDLDSILWTSRVAWLAIAIGEAAYRGQGYGGEAMSLLLRFAFHELNLHRLQLTVFSYNAPAIRLYERLGFQREGVMRECLRRDGQRFDVYLYSLLAWEWEQAAR